MIIKVLGTSVIFSKSGRNSWTNVICLIMSGAELENKDQAFQFVVDREIGDNLEFGKQYRLKSGFTTSNGKIGTKIVSVIEAV